MPSTMTCLPRKRFSSTPERQSEEQYGIHTEFEGLNLDSSALYPQTIDCSRSHFFPYLASIALRHYQDEDSHESTIPDS